MGDQAKTRRASMLEKLGSMPFSAETILREKHGTGFEHASDERGAHMRCTYGCAHEEKAEEESESNEGEDGASGRQRCPGVRMEQSRSQSE